MNKALLHQAIDLLSRREHSAKELMQKLTLRGYERSDIDDVLIFLKAENYLDDIRAAECIFRNRISRGYGWRFIENEMKQKGVANDIIQSLRFENEIDWYQQVASTYHKRFGDTEIQDQKEKAKRLRFLQYRGFSMDEILSVLKIN